MGTTIQPVVDLLLKFVTEAPGQRILGARLGMLLKTECPAFSPAQFQSRNLRQFIRTYAPGIVEQGKSGPDFFYALSGAAESTLASSGFIEPSVVRAPRTTFDWKAFSNPSYPFVLAANRETGEFQTRNQGAEIAEPWVTLPKPTSDDHLQIARDFVQTIPEPNRSILAEGLASPVWFTNFSTVVRQHGLGSSWATYRTSRLRELFDRSLTELGIPAAEGKAEASSPFVRYSSRSTGWARRVEAKAQFTPSEEALRKLVQLVVAEMPISDLRELSLPVGRVFDHIGGILK